MKSVELLKIVEMLKNLNFDFSKLTRENFNKSFNKDESDNDLCGCCMLLCEECLFSHTVLISLPGNILKNMKSSTVKYTVSKCIFSTLSDYPHYMNKDIKLNLIYNIEQLVDYYEKATK